ncbi:hypothetical protein [Streptomyces sp. cmx-18-6]|uniref:hypothetical protein n=1 Tax=Streptomyces sp. cmx-18-6 TaxID=2790930 RepID=UPI00398098F7
MPDHPCRTDLSGTWKFWVREGASTTLVASESAVEGASFVLAADVDGPAGECDLQARVQRDDRGFGLCLAVDPDHSCAAGELLRKEPTRPR